MTLRRFVDVAFAILVEEYQRLGVDLLTAIDRVNALGGPDIREDGTPAPDPVRAVDNRQSMSVLMGQLSGVKGAPV
jgi:hypothetical protein